MTNSSRVDRAALEERSTILSLSALGERAGIGGLRPVFSYHVRILDGHVGGGCPSLSGETQVSDRQ